MSDTIFDAMMACQLRGMKAACRCLWLAAQYSAFDCQKGLPVAMQYADCPSPQMFSVSLLHRTCEDCRLHIVALVQPRRAPATCQQLCTLTLGILHFPHSKSGRLCAIARPHGTRLVLLASGISCAALQPQAGGHALQSAALTVPQPSACWPLLNTECRGCSWCACCMAHCSWAMATRCMCCCHQGHITVMKIHGEEKLTSAARQASRECMML